MADHSVILLVEDRADDVVLIRKALGKVKMLNPLVVVGSGEEAMSYFQGEGKYGNRSEYPLPDLVLLDLKLPGLDGFDVLKWIRAQPGFGSVRVVVLTSSEQVYDVDRAYRLGANSFLVKPSSFENFVEVVRAMNGYWMWISKAPRVSRPDTEVRSSRGAPGATTA